MIQSILVYMGLMSIMMLHFYLCGTTSFSIGTTRTYPVYLLAFPCLLFAFVFGCRFNVGMDYHAYYLDYLYGIGSREHEIGFALIKSFFKENNFHFAFYFGFVALLQIFFFMLAFRKRAYLYTYIVAALMLSCIELGWMNGMRQSIATCVFVYATTFIEKKEPKKYVLAILFAMLFHNSAIILLPMYFITYLPILKNKKISIAIYILALFVNTLPVESFDRLFTEAARILGYSETYSAEDALTEVENGGTGLARLVLNTIFLTIVIYSDKLKEFFKNDERWFTIIYNLYIIGMFGNMSFNRCVMLNRPFGYFRVFWCVMFAILIYYLAKHRTKNNNLARIFLITLITLTFIACMLSGKTTMMEFNFFWEN